MNRILLNSILHALRASLSQTLTYTLARCVWLLKGYPAFHRQGLGPTHLTEAFRQQHLLSEDNAVSALEWQPVEWGAIGRVYRVTLRYRHPSTTLPATLIVKTLGETLPSRLTSRLFRLLELETRAVTDLRRHCAALQPEIYHVTANARLGMCCIVMEDLGHLRNQRSHTPPGASLADMRLLLRATGTLHGLTWNCEDLAHYHADSPIMTHRFAALGEAFLEGPFKPLIDRHLPHLKRALQRFSDREFHEAFLVRTRGFGLQETKPRAPRPHRYFAIGHNDVRLDNAFFDDSKQQCRLIDWQTPLFQNPVIDIVWALKELPLDTLTEGTIADLLEDYRDAVSKARRSTATHADSANVGQPADPGFTRDTLHAELPWGCYAAVTVLMYSQMIVSRIQEPIPLAIDAPIESTLLTNLRNYSVRVDRLLGLYTLP